MAEEYDLLSIYQRKANIQQAIVEEVGKIIEKVVQTKEKAE